MIGKVRAWQFQRKARDLTEQKGLAIEGPVQVDERFDTLWRAVEDRWRICLIRDSTFLKWRFEQHPVRDYKIWAARREGDLVGYAVTDVLRRDGMARGRIVDMLAHPDVPEAAELLLFHAAAQLCSEGADMLVGWFLPRTFWAPLLDKVGMRYRGDRRNIIVRLFAAENMRNEIFDPENWYYTGADTDQL